MLLRGHKKKEFISRFSFKLKSSQIKTKKYLSEFAVRKEGLLEDKERINIIEVQKRLNNPTGTYYFWFTPNKQKKDSITTFISSKSKLIFYDPKEKEVILKCVLNNGSESVTKMKIFDRMGDHHFVAITWNEQEITFKVNNNSLKIKK